MSHDYEAAHEAERIVGLSAFNIKDYTRRRKWNQHCISYYFADDSVLTLYLTSGYSIASSLLWKGNKNDTHLRPLKGLPIRVNT